MKNTFFYLFSVAFLINGCCDCLEPSEVEGDLSCEVRESTITEFDPSVELTEVTTNDPLNPIDSIYTPLDPYSIHAFRFGQGGITGTLENDDRFNSEEGIDRISVESYEIPNTTLRFAILDNAPANKDINGDILIEDVSIDPTGAGTFAIMRVKGYIGLYNQNFWSESSRDYCDFIRFNQEDLKSRYLNSPNPDYSQYGQDLPPNKLNTNTLTPQYAIIDENGNIITDDVNILNFNLFGLTPAQLRGLANNIEREPVAIYSIRIEVGDVFYYLAENGREYLISIINIDERDGGPNQEPAVKRRVSILFSEVTI
ncbi:MAG: hypothetical protein Kapaf2KO_14360 [Candidatus Kapaibacteriales bacterium]